MPIFEKGKQVQVRELIKKAAVSRTAPVIPGSGGKIYPNREWLKALNELLPYQKIGGYLSVEEARAILRKLRGEEYRTYKTEQKLKLNRLLRILEEEWGLKGKY